TFAPAVPFPPGAVVSFPAFAGQHAEDEAGNGLNVSYGSFTVATEADATPPTVLSIAPANGATAPAEDPVVATFSEAMGTVRIDLFPPMRGTTTLSPDGRTATFASDRPTFDTTFTIVVNGADRAGNPLAEVTSTYTTGHAPIQTAYASVVSSRPARGAVGVR